MRELPTGKGYADLCLIPRPRYCDKPAVLIELKRDQAAETAMAQIKDRNYPAALQAYHGNLLLCGINYRKDQKFHECVIEKWEV